MKTIFNYLGILLFCFSCNFKSQENNKIEVTLIEINDTICDIKIYDSSFYLLTEQITKGNSPNSIYFLIFQQNDTMSFVEIVIANSKNRDFYVHRSGSKTYRVSTNNTELFLRGNFAAFFDSIEYSNQYEITSWFAKQIKGIIPELAMRGELPKVYVFQNNTFSYLKMNVIELQENNYYLDKGVQEHYDSL